NIPVEFAESRWPFLVERLSLAVDSGGPGRHRGGLGYEKHIRMLRDAHFMSIADRSRLACWGVAGGRAGRPLQGVVDPGGPAEPTRHRQPDAEPRPAPRSGWAPAPPPAAPGPRGPASHARRTTRRAAPSGREPFFDRGPGYAM